MDPVSRKRLHYFLYVLAVAIVILIGFSIYFTFQLHNRLAEMVSEPGRWPQDAYIYDAEIGFDFAPGVSDHIRGGGFYVKSHSLGFRIGQHENLKEYEPGGVISLGCSFTYGDEVEAEQTFTQLIADSLGLDAYNYGISSFSYTHAMLKARKMKDDGTLAKLKPKIVVLGCWRGLLDRTRSQVPPIAGNIPLVAAHLAKDENGVYIHPPEDYEKAFELIREYRKEGTSMSAGRFFRLFAMVPRFIGRLFRTAPPAVKGHAANDAPGISDYEVYDFYFTGIEDVFSEYGSTIVVLYMPYMGFDLPDQALVDALKAHPDILLVDGYKAINDREVPPAQYEKRHPRPEAHRAYALEALKILSGEN
jgi:hypothetical protein